MKPLFLFVPIIFLSFTKSAAQDSIQHRIILLGNAGLVNQVQTAVLNDASQNALPGKTTVLFLGNNIYPSGMHPGSKEVVQASEKVLQSQFIPFRNKDVPVFFVPGIADWDNNGPLGYEKTIKLNEVIASRNDSMLQVIPGNACPGPFELPLPGNIVIVAMDTEWWLYPFNKHTDEAECECKTKRDVLGKLTDIIARNRDKVVFFATSHPFKSYGVHGGYYPFKQHIFPLASAKNDLYIPLPIIGSVYPLFRKTFPSVTDLKNPLYADMITEITNILKTHPNIVHVAAHENSLQLIKGNILEIISGATAKISPVKKGIDSNYAMQAYGYVIADVLKDNTVRLTFRNQSTEKFVESFVYNKAYTKPSNLSEEGAANLVLGDSIQMSLNKAYDNVSRLHRSLFGENYRKEWAMQINFPVLKLSQTDLKPKELGGGMQTHSLRLTDSQKKEWVFRSIEKFPDNLLPETLAKTFAAALLKDNVTAILPYAPLAVPVFANALGVPHSTPTIVYVAPDKKLGIYSKDFANTICLLEEREPAGKSISTINMITALRQDNDNSIDQYTFLKARVLDIFLADWDRHGDQWRWIDIEQGKGKLFRGVPRDRDQVFYVNQGLFLKVLSLPWVMPKFQGFGERIKNISALSFNARFIDGVLTNKLSLGDWATTTSAVVNAITDSVIETALKKLPAAVYKYAHNSLFNQLQKRRADLIRVAPLYYHFLNKIVDITATDKNDFVSIRDTLDGQLKITIQKISKRNEIGKEGYSRIFDPAVTKEIRLFLYKGSDSIVVNNNGSPIKLRIVGDDSALKSYAINGSAKYLRKVHIYEGENNATLAGETKRVHLHLSNEETNTSFQSTNRYNNTIPLLNVGYNVDDGFMLGAGIKWIKQGFRKQPYASLQQFTFTHSFSTSAFRFFYTSEWLQTFGEADFLLGVKALAPVNTQNFFGRGNDTKFDKTGNYKRYYRVRFSLYQAAPSIRWHIGKRSTLTAGPSLQFYRFDADGNRGRFASTSNTGAYDSLTLQKDKMHAGFVTNYSYDTRNNTLLPTFGSIVNTSLQAYAGLNNYSKSFGQLTADVALFKSIDHKSTIVIADRLGGGVTAGKTTFYQSLFIGGHENLRGFHQYRFAGDQILYNNLEARIKLADVASYVLPGQLGLIGFYDVGRVWQKGYDDHNTWHQGAGGGLYYAPANIAVLQLVIGSSNEGVYPYFTLGFRF